MRGTESDLVVIVQKHALESHNMRRTAKKCCLARVQSPDPKMESADRPPWGTEGPVQAEVFVVRLRGDRLELTGPCGPDAWYIESHTEEIRWSWSSVYRPISWVAATGPLDVMAPRRERSDP